MRVMLIDDSRTMRNIQRAILEEIGVAEIQEACDGQDALSRLNAFEPDLLLLDSNMPRMDGVTFIQKVRERGCRVPCIMVTSEADRENVMRAIRAGVDDYVLKPFTAELLVARIKATLERRSRSAGHVRFAHKSRALNVSP